MKPILIAPSLLSADYGCLKAETEVLCNAGADWLHIDVMDGHFVPNLTVGPACIAAIKSCCNIPIDVHLMITNPEACIDQYIQAGANHITVHVEACTHLHRLLTYIKQHGVKAGVCLNPATPLSMIEHVLQLVDLVLIMTVNPGFAGQTFIDAMLPKIAALALKKQQLQATFHIAVDGGINQTTIRHASCAGANVFIAGAAVLNLQSYQTNISILRDLARID